MIFYNEICTFIKNELATAVKYAEGRGLRIEVKTENDLKNILELIRIKLA